MAARQNINTTLKSTILSEILNNRQWNNWQFLIYERCSLPLTLLFELDVSLLNPLKIQSLLNWDVIIIFADCFSNCLLQSSKPVIRLPLSVSRIEKDNMNIQQLLVFQSSYTHIPRSHIFRSERTVGCYCYARQKDDDLKELRLVFFSSLHHHEPEIPKTVHPWEENRNYTLPGAAGLIIILTFQLLLKTCRTAQQWQLSTVSLAVQLLWESNSPKFTSSISTRRIRLIKIASDWCLATTRNKCKG